MGRLAKWRGQIMEGLAYQAQEVHFILQETELYFGTRAYTR